MLIRMERAGPGDEDIFGFGNLWIGNAAVHRAYCGAFLVIEETNAFGAFVGRDKIDVLGERRAHFTVEFGALAAFIDCVIRASRQTRSAIDTFFRNKRRHSEIRRKINSAASH